jgi:hypothetical protein
VMGVDGPFFLQSRDELSSLTVHPAGMGLRAAAGYSESGWMSWVSRLLGDSP